MWVLLSILCSGFPPESATEFELLALQQNHGQPFKKKKKKKKNRSKKKNK
jgi:hypothetical protein